MRLSCVPLSLPPLHVHAEQYAVTYTQMAQALCLLCTVGVESLLNPVVDGKLVPQEK